METLQDGQRRYIVAALKAFKNDLPEPFDEGTKTYEFTDNKKFWDYLTSDCISEIAEKCDALFIDTYEEQWLYPDILPIAIEIVSKAINQKKNAAFKDYLEQTKELMELALTQNTFFVFMF